MFSNSFSLRLAFLLILAALVVITGRVLLPRFRPDSDVSGPIVWRVERGPFLHEILAKGELESGDNVEVRCLVKAQGRGSRSAGRGTTTGRGEGERSGAEMSDRDSGPQFMILEIVPEGTRVKPGDFLVLLDASALQDELLRQQIACALAEASLVRAQNSFETAQFSLQEYVEGRHFQRRQALSNQLILETERLRQSKRNSELTKAMYRQGYATKLQVEADHFAAERVQTTLALAKTSLACLDVYTHARTVAELEAMIEVTESRLQTERQNYELSVAKLADLQEQIEKCAIRAPAPGTVVYANRVGMNVRGPQIIIEPGAMVRDGQPIIRLPNPQSMQVKVLISETNLSLVRPGQPARFSLDALPGLELNGYVTRLNDFPEPPLDSRLAGSARQFQATVSIHDPPMNLRPGMTAEVRICVNYLRDRLQVPKSAVVQQGDKQYCLVLDGSVLEPREVRTLASNGKFTVIEEGAKEGDVVVLGASRYLDRAKSP